MSFRLTCATMSFVLATIALLWVSRKDVRVTGLR